jgi:hypothetical protein
MVIFEQHIFIERNKSSINAKKILHSNLFIRVMFRQTSFYTIAVIVKKLFSRSM